MKKHIISLILSVIMFTALLPVMPAGAEQTAENNSVSGYISLSDGIKFVGSDITPAIYIDDDDYEGVKIAAQNMAVDIGMVTGKTAEINHSATVSASVNLISENGDEETAISEINQTNNTMTITGYQALTKKGRGIVAVYTGDALESVYLSENLADSENGILSFTSLPVLEGKKVKGFLWEDNNGLTINPLADVFNYTQAAEPTAIPTIEPAAGYAEIIVGTYGISEAISGLAENGDIDVSAISNGEWESFTIQTTSDNKIVIAGSDKRGTIYGIYDFCEKIGVSPWYYWADVTPAHEDELYINLPDSGYTEGEPSVKYRGIFLNDEYNLTRWSESIGDGNMNNETYEKIFELLLRLKANYLWPAMHEYSTAFNVTEGNAELADEYGIVMGSSHCEPLLRNN